MAGRKPSVRSKNGYWYSNAKGIGRYFGSCSEVSYAEAMALLWASIAEILAQSESESKILLDSECEGLLECRRRQADANSNANSYSNARSNSYSLSDSKGNANSFGFSNSQCLSNSNSEGRDREGKREERRKATALAFSHSPEPTGFMGWMVIKSDEESKDQRSKMEQEQEQGIKTHPTRDSNAQTQESKAKAESRKPVPSRSLPPPNLSLQEPSLIVNALADAFLSWVGSHRPAKAHRERERHLRRFREGNGKAEAIAIGSAQLEAFGETLKADGHAPAYVHKHLASVRMMLRWGIKHGLLSIGFNPFANAEPIYVPPKPLLESDLPTGAEVQSLIAHAQADLREMLIVYHATGARTHELIDASVGDFQPSSHTIVLGKHKRSRTMREPIPRTITLSAEALSIVQRRCDGREPSEAIFLRDTGNGRWTSEAITQRFQRIRRKAGVRENITIYSLRHLWISEALMLGLDALLVARMAGTSVAMLEKVYGHFKTSTFAAAQAKLDAKRGR